MEINFTGKTIEEAVERAAEELKISKDDFSYEVVDYPNKGFLGIGSKSAKIKVTYQASPQVYVSSYLRELFSLLGVENYKEKIELTDEKTLTIQLDGEELIPFTLKYTDIVESVQFLLIMAVNKQLDDHFKIIFNINDYKEKAASRLEALAVKTAVQVSKTKRKVALSPMSSYQRRIIHSRLQTFDNITTYSVGSEPNRKVVIAFQGRGGAGGFRRDNREGGNRTSGTGGSRPYDRNRTGGNSGGNRSYDKPRGDRPYDNNRGDRPSGNSNYGGNRRPQDGRNNNMNRQRTGNSKPASSQSASVKQIYPKPVDMSAFKTEDEK